MKTFIHLPPRNFDAGDSIPFMRANHVDVLVTSNFKSTLVIPSFGANSPTLFIIL